MAEETLPFKTKQNKNQVIILLPAGNRDPEWEFRQISFLYDGVLLGLSL